MLSETSALGRGGALMHLTADGQRSTVVANVHGPGGIVVGGSTAWFTTGNSPASGLLGLKDGTIAAVNLDTGVVSTLATGLTMPNGLERLPDGTFITSRDIGLSTRLTAVKPNGEQTAYAPSITSTNGVTFMSEFWPTWYLPPLPPPTFAAIASPLVRPNLRAALTIRQSNR